MVKTFNQHEWNDDIKTDDGTNQKGIVIHQHEHQIDSPIIQVFEKIGEEQFKLIGTNRVIVGVSDVEIILITLEPFDGKVVIK